MRKALLAVRAIKVVDAFQHTSGHFATVFFQREHIDTAQVNHRSSSADEHSHPE
jgi:hypothetical protein